jgi:hypothetical protein
MYIRYVNVEQSSVLGSANFLATGPKEAQPLAPHKLYCALEGFQVTQPEFLNKLQVF